ncbi:4Fe-4S dicluster domain-containing protein [Frisingicoccus sp.]|uniref:4Fe-4S dicluster domain-containing protein n=1 Tax=Frisingicoccus sp. TaxID=1918627 RepID=UPI003AB20F70
MDLLNCIKEAGIVGCGGAGFPTHVKYAGGPVEYLIINGAECEPLLRTDRYIMKHLGDRVVSAVEAVGEMLGAKECRIALKKTYTEEIKALEKVLKERGSKVKLAKMDSFYPAGDEQTMVYEVTGRIVPPAGIPLDVGCVVSNVATMLGISDAMEGKSFTKKYLTVTGEVNQPTVLHVPVGTSFDTCIALAGGTRKSRYFVVSGGPMMGARMTMEEAKTAVVTKTTSGILILPGDGSIAQKTQISLQHMLNRARSACIQCSYCTQMCPRHLIGHPLQPHKIMRKLAMSGDVTKILNDKDVRNAAICCECGICEEYACPMGLQPKRVNQVLKGALREAGIRYSRETDVYKVDPNREGRKIPAGRVAARVGVMPWYDLKIDTCVEGTPDRVEIPVSMHIGAPSEAVVKTGDMVTEGQLIARIPEGAMGANIHASISGKVVSVGKRIIIERTGR